MKPTKSMPYLSQPPLGYNTNNIIVDDEKSAKEAIKYLKTIGRATFFPLNIIKPKYIDNDTLNKLKIRSKLYRYCQ